MKKSKAHKVLQNAYDKIIAEKVINAYQEVESNYVLEKWKPSELDGGHFVESVRRIIEYELFDAEYTPFTDKLSSFNDQKLKEYERQVGHESFRMLIPRALKAIFNIRNKRGVGHVKDISPNEMDSTYILYSCKWILSEIVRLKSKLAIERTQQLIAEIVERRIELLWKEEDFVRILYSGMAAKDKILVLLYDRSPQKLNDLQDIIEYQHDSNFKKIIEARHKDRLIEKRENGACFISPKGITEAEKIINDYKHS